jgi:subtilisin family serine protease
MQSIKNYLIAFSVLALVLFPLPTSGQTQDYPPEFSPLRTSRPRREQRSLIPPTKFVKVQNAIPNRYIVVLNDDVVPSDAPLAVRRAQITAIANSLAQAHLGRVGFVYETALKGFSIELPNEAAAIAISQNPQVNWVEEVGRLQVMQEEPEAFQTNPPWGLDAIDGSIPVGPVAPNGTTNGIYIYNATGANVLAYVLDTGIRRTHQDFGGVFGRASIDADFINGQYNDVCAPTSGSNDCVGHGTHVAGTLGGATYGAAKAVTILSVKVCNYFGCPTDAVNRGIDWVTENHFATPNYTRVANISIGGDGPSTGFALDNAVINSIAAGVTYCVAAGNSNDDARFFSPADVAMALTVAASDAGDSRALTFPFGGGSNFGSVDLFAPGYGILSDFAGSDTDTAIGWGTSFASPHAAGAVAIVSTGPNRHGHLLCLPNSGTCVVGRRADI